MKGALEKTTWAWAGNPPDWIEALAEACEATSSRAVAARLNVSPAAVCRVLGARYGNTIAMEWRVRTVLMATRVDCPVCGEIDVETCRTNQTRPFCAVNPTFVRLFRACPTCPHGEAQNARHAGIGTGHAASDRAGTLQGSRPASAGSAQNQRG